MTAPAAPPATALEIRLRSRPVGLPTPDNFELAEAPVPKPGPGQVLVRNTIMSVDPVMRRLMSDTRFVVPPFPLGQPLEGGAVGEVVASRSDRFRIGQTVLHHRGWREFACLDEADVAEQVPDDLPAATYLGVLGVPGLTAWVGLVDIAALRPGETVYVSAAAGAVGSCVGQIARARGAARVIGSAGSPEKVRHLIEDLGFDAAFNHRDGPVADQLRTAAPHGIDIYFDNVGGGHLEAAIDVLNNFGRIALCGAVSEYNRPEPPSGPRNLFQVVVKRLTLRGFVVYLDHGHRRPAFLAEITPMVRAGRIRYDETVLNGLHRAPEALVGLFHGANTGKMLVQLT